MTKTYITLSQEQKSYDQKLHNTLEGTSDDDVHVNHAFTFEQLSTLKAIKSNLNGHIINRILHSWSFHMKFMKLSTDSFHKFHMKWPVM